MNKKRKITVKNARLRKLRYELRSLIREAYLNRRDELHEKLMASESIEIKISFSKKRQELDRVFKKSPICCKYCGDMEGDHVYNPYLEAWFCEDCYQIQQDYYLKHGQPELYP